MTATMTAALWCAATLGSAVFVLGANVSRLRGLTAAQGGDQMPTDPASPLLLAIRAHGNASEYVPTLLVLFLLTAWLQPSWLVTTLIVGATISRLAHATSMLTAPSLAHESRLRLAGAIGTYVFGLALAITVAYAAVMVRALPT